MKKKLTRAAARAELRKTGTLTTALLAPLGISMDQFLRFAQMTEAQQRIVIAHLLE